MDKDTIHIGGIVKMSDNKGYKGEIMGYRFNPDTGEYERETLDALTDPVPGSYSNPISIDDEYNPDKIAADYEAAGYPVYDESQSSFEQQDKLKDDPQDRLRASYGSYKPYTEPVQNQQQATQVPAPMKQKRKDREKRTVLGMKRKHFTLLLVIIICGMLCTGFTGGLIGAKMTPGSVSYVGTAGGGSANITINPSDNIGTTEAVAKKVLDSVVGITASYTSEGQDFFGFDTGPQMQSGVGTGMIVDSRGYILTNSHVIMDGKAEEIDVLLSDGSTKKSELLWFDASLDLAIVKIDSQDTKFHAIELGDSSNLSLGQYVAAIGNPLGLDFNSSITAGIISGLDRTITASDGNKVTQMEGLIQVDAAINSGNSGGPLLNSEGQAIGVNTAKAQTAEGMGFAIPIDTVKPIIESVIKTGNFERVYIGISAGDANSIAKQYPNLNLDEDIQGAIVTAVSPGGPAEKAGLKMKDVITAVEGKDITSSASLIKTLLNYKAGDVVTLSVIRDGREYPVKVKLATQARAYSQEEENPFGEDPYGDDPFAP